MILADVLHLFASLSPDRVMRMARGFLHLEEGSELNTRDCLKLLVVNMLEGCTICDEAQSMLVLPAFDEFFDAAAERIDYIKENTEETISEPIMLVVNDFKYFSARGYENFYNAREAQWVKEIPEVSVAYLAIDLIALMAKFDHVVANQNQGEQDGSK